MEKPFRCAACPTSYGQRQHLVRHQKTAHERLKPFQCDECLKSYGRKDHLASHVRYVHDGFRPHACKVCSAKFATKEGLRKHSVLHMRLEGIQCPVCRAKLKTKASFVAHMSQRHPVKEASGLKRNQPMAKPNVACPSPPYKRIKKETQSAADLNDEGVEKFLNIAEGMEHGNENPGSEASEVEAATKREDDNVVDSPPPLLRSMVKFKTSSGRVRIAEGQPASMTYADFRELFGIPLNTPKRVEFMKSAYEWIVAVDDNMKLPLVDGCIVAETCTDF